MYNAYEDILRRRQLPEQSAFQQPAPMYAQPQPTGPQMPMQWVPGMGDDQQQQQDMSAGIGALLKRFQKPAGSGIPGFGGGTPGGTDIGRSIKLPGFSGFGK